jgi:hypothetical protein
MAASPEFKVYDPSGVYQAACKEPELAAAVVSVLGEGATIRHGHSVRDTVWTEGVDGCAADSYDLTRQSIIKTILKIHQQRRSEENFERYGGERRLYPLD